VNDENLLGILKPHDARKVENPEETVDAVIQNSLDSGLLTNAADKKIVVVVELSNTNAQTLMAVTRLLEKLNGKGILSDVVRILLTTETAESIRSDKEKYDLWHDRLAKYSITEHDPSSSECIEVGKTSRGVKVFLNKSFVEADLKIVVSDVSLHRFFGYRGGCSAILPGLASAATIRHNHAALVNANARLGVIEGNPMHEDMEEASKLAGVSLGLCISTGLDGSIVGVYAGDLLDAFHKASAEYGETCKVIFKQKGEIVIASAGGAPNDVDLHHASMALEAALKVVKDQGAIILVAECPKGHGNKVFLEWTRQFKDLKEIQDEIKKRYVSGGESAYCLLRAREKARIYLVSVMPDYYASNIFKLRTARTTNAALQTVQRAIGKDSKIMVLPYAMMTLPTPEETQLSGRA
jgi:nickel-dependent lactate racemase